MYLFTTEDAEDTEVNLVQAGAEMNESFLSTIKLKRFLIKFRATYLCSITLFMAIPGYFKMHIAWIIYLLFLICRYPFIHQPFNELY